MKDIIEETKPNENQLECTKQLNKIGFFPGPLIYNCR